MPSKCYITLWAIWTRLSILVPSPINVVRVESTVDGGVGADLDVVLNNDTADLRISQWPSAPGTKPEAVLSDCCAPDGR